MKGKAIIVTLMFIGVLVLFTGCKHLGVREEEPAPVFTIEREDGRLKEDAVPSGEEILRALRSDNPDSVHFALAMIDRLLLPRNSSLWPSDLQEEDIYPEITRILELDPKEDFESETSLPKLSFRYAIKLVDPKRKFDGYYRSEEDVQRVKRAIERWNATQSERDRSFHFYELILDDDGDPVKLEWYGGGYD